MTRKDRTELITFVTLPSSAKRARARKTRPVLPENSRVKLSSPVELDDGRTLPSGSAGTVVGIWAKGAAYEVEFMEPFHAVVTIASTKLERVAARR